MSEGIQQAAGTSFIVRELPGSLAPVEAALPAVLSVLLIGDGVTGRISCRSLLADGIAVSAAGEPAEALARLARAPPDCVVVTEPATGVGCLETLALMKDSQGKLPCAVILLGADNDVELAVSAMKAGAIDVIPYSHVSEARVRDAICGAVGSYRQNHRRGQRARENAHLAAIVTFSADAILSLDADGATVRIWSPGATQLFGYNEAEAIGRTIDELIIPEHKRPERGEILAAVMQGQRGLLLDTERKHKSGMLVPVEINVSPIALTGTTSGYSVILRDVSERRRAQERIRLSQDRLALREAELSRAQRIARIGSYEVHCEHGQFVNRRSPEYLQIHGLPPEASNETHEDWVQRMHPEDRGWSEAAFKKAVAEGAREYEAEYRIIRPSDGQLRWIKVLAEIDRDANGNAIRLFGTHIDITERKQAEENVRLLMREVNHRSKNMLSLVQAVARQTVSSNPKEFLKRFEERIQALAKSQDLLVESEWKGVDLEALARSQLAHLQDATDHQRISLSGPGLRVTAAAAQTIGMALHELATNAAKYGALSGDKGRVDVVWHLVGPTSVAMTFEIDWKESGGPPVEPPTRRGFGSTIIGAMAQTNLKGAAVASYLIDGLHWHLSCPAERVLEGPAAHAGAKPSGTSIAPKPASAPSILVVEDEALVALEISRHLQQAGWHVLGPAGNVADALALVYANRCAVAVLDVNLGSETSEPVASELIRRAIPFAAVSGYSRDQQPFVFRTCPLLPKPLHGDQLVSEIARIGGLQLPALLRDD